MSAQVRLEALKLAVQSGAEGGNILNIAEEYTDFINNGPKVVEIRQEGGTVGIQFVTTILMPQSTSRPH